MNPRILITRKAGRFYLYVLEGMRVVETITALSASLIWDYLENNWPVGTKARWIIL